MAIDFDDIAIDFDGIAIDFDDIAIDQGDVLLRPLTLDISELRGILKRPGAPALSVEEMDEAILREHSGKR